MSSIQEVWLSLIVSEMTKYKVYDFQIKFWAI